MPHTVLFDNGTHRNVLLEDFAPGSFAVQANQHLIIHGASGMILDPGGHKIYSKVLAATMQHLGRAKLEILFLSHQDPDIVAAVNGWLMTTDATAYLSNLWIRFVAHFGLDRLVESRLKPIPDKGMRLSLGGQDMLAIPAHFLHSPGNFQLYDPVSKILYSGDLGASVGGTETEVLDFDQHLPFMEGFHKRYMSAGRAMKNWAKLARQLDIDLIAPQHGGYFKGKAMVGRFIDWCDGLACGVDLLDDVYRVPE
ncbi:MAG: MBL fold metallo-hydrolase [Polyangiales bacterium]